MDPNGLGSTGVSRIAAAQGGVQTPMLASQVPSPQSCGMPKWPVLSQLESTFIEQEYAGAAHSSHSWFGASQSAAYMHVC